VMSLGKHSVKTLMLASLAALPLTAARAAYDYTILGGATWSAVSPFPLMAPPRAGILVGGIAVTGNVADTVPGYQSFHHGLRGSEWQNLYRQPVHI